jgi:hypothetical protein
MPYALFVVDSSLGAAMVAIRVQNIIEIQPGFQTKMAVSFYLACFKIQGFFGHDRYDLNLSLVFLSEPFDLGFRRLGLVHWCNPAGPPNK